MTTMLATTTLAETLAVLSFALPQAPEPDADNLREWMTFVQPAPHEQSYREIGWRNAITRWVPPAQPAANATQR